MDKLEKVPNLLFLWLRDQLVLFRVWPLSSLCVALCLLLVYGWTESLIWKTQPRLWILSYKVTRALVLAAGHRGSGVLWVMWSVDLYLGSVPLPSNSWLMVCGNSESRSHQAPWVWRLPHYLVPFTAGLRKFYSQIRLHSLLKENYFRCLVIGEQKAWWSLSALWNVGRAFGDPRAGALSGLPSLWLQGWSLEAEV